MTDPSVYVSMLSECNERMDGLVRGGCDGRVAYERTLDALRAVLRGTPDAHAYDPRDRAFEERLRELYGGGQDA